MNEVKRQYEEVVVQKLKYDKVSPLLTQQVCLTDDFYLLNKEEYFEFDREYDGLIRYLEHVYLSASKNEINKDEALETIANTSFDFVSLYDALFYDYIFPMIEDLNEDVTYDIAAHKDEVSEEIKSSYKFYNNEYLTDADIDNTNELINKTAFNNFKSTVDELRSSYTELQNALNNNEIGNFNAEVKLEEINADVEELDYTFSEVYKQIDLLKGAA